MDQSKPAPSGGVNVGRLLLVIIPLALIVFGVGFAMFYKDGAFLSGLFQPPLMKVTGTVYWNGRPLKGGEIRTQPTDQSKRGSSGPIDQNGKFVLQTFVDRDLREGAYAGTHKVIVQKLDQSVRAMGFAPPPATPEKYQSYETSDVTIEISRDPNKNDLKIEISGNGPKGQNNSEEEEKAAATAAAAPPAERPPPAVLVKQMMEKNDANKDGKLDKDEQRGLGTMAMGIHNEDANKDGFIDEEELLNMFKRMAP